MEGSFQNQNGSDEANNQNHINAKKSSMSLSVTGLWDVVPRMEYYRYCYNEIYKYKINNNY